LEERTAGENVPYKLHYLIGLLATRLASNLVGIKVIAVCIEVYLLKKDLGSQASGNFLTRWI
jgi:hypothetical protein